jgi:hypothetical protein
MIAVTSHLLKLHVLLPVGLFLLLVVAGVPFRTAVVVGMASGCLAMLFMMTGHGSRGHPDHERERSANPDRS